MSRKLTHKIMSESQYHTRSKPFALSKLKGRGTYSRENATRGEEGLEKDPTRSFNPKEFRAQFFQKPKSKLSGKGRLHSGVSDENSLFNEDLSSLSKPLSFASKSSKSD